MNQAALLKFCPEITPQSRGWTTFSDPKKHWPDLGKKRKQNRLSREWCA